MVKIRLTRVGKKHQISYRIVAQDERTKRDGATLEILGYFNPYNKPQLRIDRDKVNSWVARGAQLTEAVTKLMSTTDKETVSTQQF